MLKWFSQTTTVGEIGCRQNEKKIIPMDSYLC